MSLRGQLGLEGGQRPAYGISIYPLCVAPTPTKLPMLSVHRYEFHYHQSLSFYIISMGFNN